MKASFEFNLPDEEEAFSIHSQAIDIYTNLCSLDQYLRGLSKHEGRETVNIDKLRDILNSILFQGNHPGFSGL